MKTNEPTIYVLSRDGAEVYRGTFLECMSCVHKRHSFSFEWAQQFEGYSLSVLPSEQQPPGVEHT